MHALNNLFAVDKTLPTPLFAQFRDNIRQFMETPGNRRLPSERQLAKLGGVSRRTVRKALGEFARMGVFSRGVRGTYLVRKSESSPSQGHPFVEYTAASIGLSHHLKFVLFENFPSQRRVWGRIVDLFNQAYPDSCLEIEWLPDEVNTLALYKEFIRRHNPDIVQLSYGFAQSLRGEEFLAPLPNALAQTLRSKEYYSDIVGADTNAVLSYVVPVHVPSWGVVWNEELAGKGGPFVAQPSFNQDTLIRWMLEVGRRPSPGLLLANAWVLPMTGGFPILSLTEDALRRFFEDSFSRMAVLNAIKDRFLWTESRSAFFIKPFCDGKSAFFAGNFGHILNALPFLEFPWQAMFLVPEPGYFMPTGWCCAGVPKNSRQPETAMRVLQFISSKTAQDEIATGAIGAPFLKESGSGLLAIVKGADKKNMEASMRHLFILESQSFDWSYFINRTLRFLYQEVMEGKRSVSDAVQQALERVRQKGLL